MSLSQGGRGLECYVSPPLFGQEYESLYTSHIWIPSSWCSPTQRPECDITEDITATVSYSLRGQRHPGLTDLSLGTLKHRFSRTQVRPFSLLPAPQQPPLQQPPLQQPCSLRLLGFFPRQMSLTKSECYKHRQP